MKNSASIPCSTAALPVLFAILFLIVFPSLAQPFLSWTKTLGTNKEDEAMAMTLDKNGNIYSAALFHDSIDADPDMDEFLLYGNNISTITKFDTQRNFIWAKSFSSSQKIRINSIAVDNFFNILIAGSFRYTVDFDPGPSIFNLTAVAKRDFFICKLDPNGNFIWAKQIGGPEWDEFIEMALDETGDIYLTGGLSNIVDFDPGPGVYNLSSTWSSLFYTPFPDIFISKLTANGEFVWARSFSGMSLETPAAIALDKSGNIYLTGELGGLTDFDPGIGVHHVSPHGPQFDGFLCKLDNSGNLIWAFSIGAFGTDRGTALAIDASDNILVSGSFLSTVDFDPGQGIYNLTSIGFHSNFVAKYSPSAELLWTKNIGMENFSVHDITVDLFGNSYCTGKFYHSNDFDPSSAAFELEGGGFNDVFVEILDASGNFINAFAMGGTEHDVGINIVSDANGNIYLNGTFKDTADLLPGPSEHNFVSNGKSDVFISKLSYCELQKANPCFVALPDQQLSGQPSIEIYPNPSNGIFTLSLSHVRSLNTSRSLSAVEVSSKSGVEVSSLSAVEVSSLSGVEVSEIGIEQFSIHIKNILGETIYQSSITISNIVENQVKIPVSLSQPQGIYFIEVKAGDKIWSEKIIIN